LVAERHLVLARSAAASLNSAVVAIGAGAPLDVAAVDLWEALRSLREITGEDASERVLDAIFSTFCVGK
jgi:tRNA modification GTPase